MNDALQADICELTADPELRYRIRTLVYRHAASVVAKQRAAGDVIAEKAEDPFLSTSEAVAESGFSRRTFQRAVAMHEIPAWRPNRRKNLFRRSDVVRWAGRKISDDGATLAPQSAHREG